MPASYWSRSSSDGAPSATARILVVDDRSDFRELVRVQLRRRPDLQVVGEAADGLRAIELAAVLQPDLVICDVYMPRLGGVEAIAEIRRLSPTCRVLVLTGHDDAATHERALAAGAHAYAVKDHRRPAALLEMIDEALDRPRGPDSGHRPESGTTTRPV